MNFLSLSWWRKVYATGGRVFAIGCAFVFAAPIIIGAGLSLNQRKSNQPEQASGTVAIVNGQPITDRDFQWIPSESLGGAPGRAHADAYGRALYSLVIHKVVEQQANKLKVHASDADVDRAIAKARESKMPANSSDSDWENYLSDRMHTSPAEFREYMAGQANVQALLDHYKNAELVTVDDAKNQYSEVKLATVFVASRSATSSFPGAPKSLPDADAAIKANNLHAQVVAGADIIPFAKANPDPFQATAKSTGIGDWQKENQENQFGSALMFGKDVDTAVRATAVGKVTDVVKASGFQSGYFFAKVIDRRINLPKDYDVNKVTASLKEQRSYKKLDAIIKAAVKAAKVEFPKDQPGMRAYYDYAKLQNMQQEMNGGMMGNASPDAPTPAQMDVQKAAVDADFEALLKAHPDDTTAVLLVAENLQSKMFVAPHDEQLKIRDRLIGLYETAFKTTEDIPTRFTLAGLYRDKQDYKSAFRQYAMVIKLLNEDAPYDLNTRQKQLTSRTQVLTGLRSLPAATVPEAATAIGEQQTKINDLTARIALDKQKENEDRIKQDAARKEAQLAAQKQKELDKNKPVIKPGTAGAVTPPPTVPVSPGAPGNGNVNGAPATGAVPPGSASAPKR